MISNIWDIFCSAYFCLSLRDLLALAHNAQVSIAVVNCVNPISGVLCAQPILQHFVIFNLRQLTLFETGLHFRTLVQFLLDLQVYVQFYIDVVIDLLLFRHHFAHLFH